MPKLDEKMDAQFRLIADRIIAQLEVGVGEWERCWKLSGVPPQNLETGHVYTGGNSFWLQLFAMISGFPTNYWVTFKGAQKLGGSVIGGAKSAVIARPRFAKNSEEEEARTGRKRKFVGMSALRVFNVEEVDGLEGHPALSSAEPVVPEAERISSVEQMVRTTGVEIRRGGDRAYYRPASGHIQMPFAGQFASPLAYYSTLVHELGHWTNREGWAPRGESAGRMRHEYCIEELRVELATAMTLGALGMPVRMAHPEYLNSYLKALNSGPEMLREIFPHARDIAALLVAASQGKRPDEGDIEDSLDEAA